jgi:membrane protein required for colicin V production
MNALDWVFIVILALLGIRCMIKGFIAEVLSVAAILLGLLAAIFLYKAAGRLFVGWGIAAKPEIVPAILGFAAVFLLTFLLIKLIAHLLREGIEAAELGGVDRALGLVLGLAEGLVLVSLVLIAMSLLEPTLKSIAGYSKLLDGSFFAKLILPIIGPEVAKATQGIKLDAPKLELQLKAPAIKKP